MPDSVCGHVSGLGVGKPAALRVGKPAALDHRLTVKFLTSEVDYKNVATILKKQHISRSIFASREPEDQFITLLTPRSRFQNSLISIHKSGAAIF